MKRVPFELEQQEKKEINNEVRDDIIFNNS